METGPALRYTFYRPLLLGRVGYQGPKLASAFQNQTTVMRSCGGLSSPVPSSGARLRPSSSRGIAAPPGSRCTGRRQEERARRW